MSAFCLCMFTACDSDDNNLLCYGTTTLQGAQHYAGLLY